MASFGGFDSTNVSGSAKRPPLAPRCLVVRKHSAPNLAMPCPRTDAGFTQLHALAHVRILETTRFLHRRIRYARDRTPPFEALPPTWAWQCCSIHLPVSLYQLGIPQPQKISSLLVHSSKCRLIRSPRRSHPRPLSQTSLWLRRKRTMIPVSLRPLKHHSTTNLRDRDHLRLSGAKSDIGWEHCRNGALAERSLPASNSTSGSLSLRRTVSSCSAMTKVS